MSRNSDLGYKFYMVNCDKNGKVAESATEYDLEKDFEGLLYSKATGLYLVGKPRIYTEKYADSDKLRVYMPDTVVNEPTTVNFTFLFTGENRYTIYKTFVDYVRNGFKRYYDNVREKYLYFFVNTEIKPAEEVFYGSKPYLKLDLTVQNIFGRTFDESI